MGFEIEDNYKRVMTPKMDRIRSRTKLEKLEEKVLGGNDSDIDISMTSNKGNSILEREGGKKKEPIININNFNNIHINNYAHPPEENKGKGGNPKKGGRPETPREGRSRSQSKERQKARGNSKSGKVQQERYLINLEEVILVEDKEWYILEGLRNGMSVAHCCEEYWRLTKNESISDIFKLFRDESTRRKLRQSMILEVLSISLVDYSLNEKEIQKSQEIRIQLKNMMFYVHQNFLLVIHFILHRLPKDSNQNVI